MRKSFSLIIFLCLQLCLYGQTITANGPTNICDGKSVQLTLTSPPPGVIQWKKDGTNIPGANGVSYSASATGDFSVTVADTLNYGPVKVTTFKYPQAGFSLPPANQCSNIPLTFNNTSTGTGLTYSWSFGDSNSGSQNESTSVHPTHTFIGTPGNSAQNFSVKLIADNAGCKDSITQTVTTRQVPGVEMGGTGAVVYNGLNYFTRCASTTSDFTFSNKSSTVGTNTSYRIKWGDGTADFVSNAFTLTNHTYSIGNYHLQFIVSGGNNCADTGDYYVFVGNNPAVGFNNPGNTFICSQSSLTFPITGTANNPPGTIYTVQFNDLTQPVTFNHPAPASITHFFDRGSCGTNRNTPFPHSFQADIQASNPCGTSAASVIPIYVSEKAKATIGYSPDTVICVNNLLTVSNQSGSGYGISGSGLGAVCTPGKGIWSIFPATGWTLTSGTLGNDFGTSDPGLWQDGSQMLRIRFTSPGTYTVKLKTSASDLCGGDEVTRTFCVNPAPVADFTTSVNSGCAPLTVKTTNKSNTPLCKSNTYQWSVSYSNSSGCTPSASAFTYLNNTSATSEAPEFQFTNPGVYTLSLITKNSDSLCTSSAFTQTIVVKEKPQVTLTAPAAVCQNGSINPSAIVNNCYANNAATYAWQFPGGMPSSSTASSPGNITYDKAGTYTITLEVTNECGTTTITKNITVNPAPDVAVPADLTFCAEEKIAGIAFTSSVAGATFTWTNNNALIGLPASGSGSLPPFTAINTSGTPITGTIDVVPTSGCTGTGQSFTITINPTPAKPTVVRPINYCLNDAAAPLNATASANNTLNWYTAFPLSNPSATAPVPTTTVNGSSTFLVTQTNGYSCESDTARILVSVSPRISNNLIAADQIICSGSSAQLLTQTGPLQGGSGAFVYQWQQSTDEGASWTNIGGGTSATYNPGPITVDTRYRRLVFSSGCTDTSNVVNVTVLGSLTNNTISAAQTICAGTIPDELKGETPSGGNGSFAFQWQSSPDGTTWIDIAAATSADYRPPVLQTTTFYRRGVASGKCQVYSAPVQITVNPKPVLASLPDRILCNRNNAPAVSFSSTPAAVYTWTNDNTAIGLAAAGTGNLPVFTTTNNSRPKVPVTATITVIPTFTNNGVSCVGDAVSFKMVVLPTVTLAPVNDTSLCTGQTMAPYKPLPDTGSYAGVKVDYQWTVSGAGISLSGSTGDVVPPFTTNNPGTSDLVATVTIIPRYTYSNFSCEGEPMSYKVTVKPSTPGANAGADQVLCAQTGAALSAAVVPGTTGVWTQVGTTATFADPASPITTVGGLIPGTVYRFIWTQNGFASCPATSDTVIIDNKAPLENKLTSSPFTICAGVQVNVGGAPATGGSGNFSYQWQQSADGINFSDMAGETSQNLRFAPTSDVWLRRFVSALPCSGFSDTLKITVQPAISNNSISQNTTICIGIAAPTITGTTPSGGDNNFIYGWEQSTDGGATWTIIPGATTPTYSPGVLPATTQFRRLVSTALCNGAFGNVSNVITVTVNPNATASFSPTTTLSCSPFEITTAIINLQPSPANNQYLWYANDVLIGTGVVFPNYTITKENDSVTIKLKAISAFGCKNDSVSHQFKTPKRPSPSFDLSETEGCGPLKVTATNTSTYINEFTYFWDFGNGVTYSTVQPPEVTFAANPAFGDTTYIITLKVFSPCDTLTFTRSVLVKSAPKALFTPGKTVGCSPMKISFRNNSLGNNNTYFWDFGDGATFSTINRDPVEHTFITGKVDTFFVKLKVINECGEDSAFYAIVVSPNTIKFNIAVNGTEHFGCAPHAVRFINNSAGAGTFQWNFGDGNILSTSKNIDTVYHTYQSPGQYAVQIRAFNSCSDTTGTETIVVYPKPKAAFRIDKNAVCIGDSIRFTNLSNQATSYLWNFGDGRTTTEVAPAHRYNTPGLYTVKLIIYRNNASGNICVDSVEQQVQVVSTLPGNFTANDTVALCAPFQAVFVNQNKPSVTALWNFGDGATGSGDSVVHTYANFGTYPVSLTVTVPGGCTYVSQKTVTVKGPGGSLRYNGGYVCPKDAVQLQAVASNTDSYVWDFGDGNSRTTTQLIVFHQYQNPGAYLPSVKLQNNAGCVFPLKGIDTIRVDRIVSGFRTAQQQSCGATTVAFADTSHVFFGKASVKWVFGDGTTGTGINVNHVYTTSGTYPVEMIVYSNSGCSDTVRKQLAVRVNSQPVAVINALATGCTRNAIRFTSNIQSKDAVTLTEWRLSNGVTANGPSFTYTFLAPGTYTVRLVAGTVNGCYDTATHTITINPSPDVTASADANLCKGSTTPLKATGAATYQWMPLQGLSCYDCPAPLAAPSITTPYVVEGKNSFGCADYDTVVITVIQPLKLKTSPNDSICIGESSQLLVSGGTGYTWSPAAGLSSTTVSNPVATPQRTTTYRVVGYDGFNCFTDTAFITVAVGQYPTVNLGPDLTLAAGTLHSMTSTVTNGPIRNWAWTPSADLSCSTCPEPVATIKKDISYAVKVTTPYGCSAQDTVSIKVFCESTQVFVPNAFTPDGDGVNDVLMVRAKGVLTVKFFRIFNRWGEVVFEKSNFPPNDLSYGWDGRIRGVIGGPDVYVYTCEVMCENGTSFTYKGNVSIIK